MYRVLVPVGESEARARQAAEIVVDLTSAGDDVEAVVLNVFEEFEVPGEGESIDSKDLYDETEFPASVAVAEERLQSAGVSVSKRREHGDPTEEILAVAREIDAHDIAMSGRKRSPTGKVLFGSVTQSVMLEADRPVTVMMSE
jgi:nucleotide-binding universal stress UspA family protein